MSPTILHDQSKGIEVARLYRPRDIDSLRDLSYATGKMYGTPTVRTRRWTRREYERMIVDGFFRPDERLELVDGRLLVKEPQHTPHAAAVLLVLDALRAAFGTGWLARPGLPVALDRWSEPEPDVSVVRGAPRDYLERHPARPVLVVEVADTRLAFDRTRKASLYARAGIADYWIVNLVDRVLEVHREPGRADPPARRGGYRSIQTLAPEAVVSPLAAGAARILVADLLP